MTGDAPLTPGPDHARRLLEVELARPEYADQPSLLERLMRWLGAHVGGPDVGAGVPVGVAVVVALALIGLAVVVWRLRDARQVVAERRRREAGLTDPSRTADDYRDEARAHLDEGSLDRAVVAAFRAVVVELDEQDVVRDAPGRTAHEVALAGAAARPDQGPALLHAADVFDAACYGHPDDPLPGAASPQRSTRADAERLLALTVRPAGVVS